MERAREIDASLFLGDVQLVSAQRGQRDFCCMDQGSCETPNGSEIERWGIRWGSRSASSNLDEMGCLRDL